MLQANQSALTDLSKLGKPGAKFTHDFLLPGTQLTFPQSQTKQLAALNGVAAVSSGLMLSGVHQQGTVPKIIAKFRTGGQRLTVTGRVQFQQTPAERAKIQACFQKAIQTSGGTAGAGGGDDPGARRERRDRRDRSGREPRRQRRRRRRERGRRRRPAALLLRLGRGAEVPARPVPQLPRARS